MPLCSMSVSWQRVFDMIRNLPSGCSCRTCFVQNRLSNLPGRRTGGFTFCISVSCRADCTATGGQPVKIPRSWVRAPSALRCAGHIMVSVMERCLCLARSGRALFTSCSSTLHVGSCRAVCLHRPFDVRHDGYLLRASWAVTKKGRAEKQRRDCRFVCWVVCSFGSFWQLNLLTITGSILPGDPRSRPDAGPEASTAFALAAGSAQENFHSDAIAETSRRRIAVITDSIKHPESGRALTPSALGEPSVAMYLSS